MEKKDFQFEYDFHKILDFVEPYYILSVVLIGIASNSIAFFIFVLKKKLVKQVNQILISLAFVDNFFLLCLLVANLKMFKH